MRGEVPGGSHGRRAGEASPAALSPRYGRILREIIQSYILTGEPVSSRLIAKLDPEGQSAATIRNMMADLEEWGYLAQPHTSAGRVPTPAGYHLFIETLMESRALPARQRRYIADAIHGGGPGDGDQLMSVTSHLLSELSSQVGIVVTPAIGDSVLKTIEFVPMSGCRALCVVVSTGGFVDSKVVHTDAPIPREELVRISNYLTASFAGLTLRQIRERLLAMMAEERAQVDRLLQVSISLASRGLEASQGAGVVVDGTSSLLARPQPADIERVKRLLDTFGDKARLVQLLNRCMEGGGMRVFIGEDSDLTADDFSLVATTYGAGEHVLGSLGIFGPSRMEYPRIVPLVHYLGEALSRALAAGEQG
jgi:heat-inducible transcriptional repressor